MDFNQFLIQLNPPEHAKVDVVLIHNGQVITAKEWGENPEIKELLPPLYQIKQERDKLAAITSQGMISILEVSEKAITPYPDAKSWEGK